MKIAVLFGGLSEERDVSVASAAQIVPALRGLGHEVCSVDTATGRLTLAQERLLLARGIAPAPPTNEAIATVRTGAVQLSAAALDIRAVDVVFVALHGGAGEDGRLQAMLDLAGMSYTGSNHVASAVAMDKDLSKGLFRSVGIATPDWRMAPVAPAQVGQALGWPVVVKPNQQGSTVGLEIVREAAALEAAIARAQAFDAEVLVEKFIAGREFTVGILDGVALPVGEIHVTGDVFDYRAKYQEGAVREVFPAEIADAEASAMQALALRAHQVLKLGAYSRVDFRRDREGVPWCLEVNALPGLTATSLLPKAAKAAGIEFADLLERICAGAVRSNRRVSGGWS
jgi:D-alanine-D-alanine ligase